MKDKQNVPTRESDGRPDDIVAKDFWEDHLKRNKSVIVDLFQGQLKSRLVRTTSLFFFTLFLNRFVQNAIM